MSSSVDSGRKLLIEFCLLLFFLRPFVVELVEAILAVAAVGVKMHKRRPLVLLSTTIMAGSVVATNLITYKLNGSPETLSISTRRFGTG